MFKAAFLLGMVGRLASERHDDLHVTQYPSIRQHGKQGV